MKNYLVLTAILLGHAAWAATPQELLNTYETAAGKASSARGELFFNTKHGQEWSCSTCHSSLPTKPTRHVVTGNEIAPLAPSANAKRFTDIANTEKWFRRNCKDVLTRECTVQEKADVIAWMLNIK